MGWGSMHRTPDNESSSHSHLPEQRAVYFPVPSQMQLPFLFNNPCKIICSPTDGGVAPSLPLRHLARSPCYWLPSPFPPALPLLLAMVTPPSLPPRCQEAAGDPAGRVGGDGKRGRRQGAMVNGPSERMEESPRWRSPRRSRRQEQTLPPGWEAPLAAWAAQELPRISPGVSGFVPTPAPAKRWGTALLPASKPLPCRLRLA